MDYNQNNSCETDGLYYSDSYDCYHQVRRESGIGIASMILGSCAFLINPLYICSLLSLIFSIVGFLAPGKKKICATVGFIDSIFSMMFQLFIDIAIYSVFGGYTFFC